MGVGEAPGEYGFDGLAFKGDGEVAGIDAGDDAVDIGEVGGGGDVGFLDGLVVDVELGEVDLEAESLGPDSVPEDGRRVFLRGNSNISTGGDSIDFTDSMPDIYKRLAERAAAACGARISGVDMIVPDIDDASEGASYSVIELNYNPALHIHDFPAEGENRRVETFVLDLLGIADDGEAPR